MEKDSNNIRTQLLLAVSFFTITTVLIAIAGWYFISKIHNVYKVSNSMQGMYKTYSQTIASEQKFFFLETTKKGFFETGNSIYLDELKENLQATHEELNNLRSQEAFEDFHIEDDLEHLFKEINEHESLFRIAIDKVRAKGFNDVGIEGKMQGYFNDLKSRSKEIGIENILMLRSYEKDYFISNDPLYIQKFNNKIEYIKNYIWYKPNSISSLQKETLERLLNHYQNSFMELVSINREIGHKDNTGINNLLSSSKDNIDANFSIIQRKTEIIAKGLVSDIERAFVFVVVNILLISIFLLIFYTKRTKSTKREKSRARQRPVVKGKRRIQKPLQNFQMAT